MYILGNPVIGRIFANNNMKLNMKGLFLVNDKYNIFVTDDYIKIAELLEVNVDIIHDSQGDDFHDEIIKSPYFHAKRFLHDPSKGECKGLVEMKDYLERKGITEKFYKKISLTDLFNFFREEGLQDKFEKTCTILQKTKHVKQPIDGKFILKYFPSIDKTKIREILDTFFNKFDNDIERDYFTVTASESDKLDILKEIVNHG